ncbi:MAG: aldo/keto reductase, partial [Anaerolineae bacterium]|nr:aldo/keto reductase [Anaerolineae bacterium]
IGVVVYSPMASGVLTEKFSREWAASLPRTTRRRNAAAICGDDECNLMLLEGLKAISDRYGRTVSQLAIAWTLRRPEVTAAIVGHAAARTDRTNGPSGGLDPPAGSSGGDR